ncbi:unnamed protein product [Brassica rapa subsp. narinosa]
MSRSVHGSVHGKGQHADMCTHMVHHLSKISTRTVHGHADMYGQHADMSSVHGSVHGKGQRADMCTDMVHQLSRISTRTVHGKGQHADMCGQHADIFHGKGQHADMCTDMVHQLSKISTRTVHGKGQHADMCVQYTDQSTDSLCVLTDRHGRPACADGRPVNLRKDHCRTLETERPENDETSVSVGRFLTVPADSVVMRSSLAKTSVLVGSYA